MQDLPTVVSRVTRAPVRVATEQPASVGQRVKLTPVRKLTRAHLALSERPQAVAEARGGLDAVAAHLSAQLGAPVTLAATLTDATLHPFSHLARNAVFALVELGGDAVGVLEVDPVATSALLQLLAGTQPAQPGSVAMTHIEEAAFGCLLLSTLSALRAQEGFAARYTPRLLSFHVERGPVLEGLDARRRHLAIGIDLTVGDCHGHARLLVPALWLQSTVQTMPVEYPSALAAEVGAAELDAQCCMGHTQLAADDAASLQPGDVVVFKDMSTPEGTLCGPVRLTTETFLLEGTTSPQGFTLTRALPRTPLESTMSTLNPTLPVDVEVELTRVRLPVSQLAALRPGGVLPLHINAAQQVVLRIGDRAVANAELVEIEGEIGARIISLL